MEVAIHRPRLLEIYELENLDYKSDDPTQQNSRAHLDHWCGENARFGWSSDILMDIVTWDFDDHNDALLFKLTWA